jgi:hypothetical protein
MKKTTIDNYAVLRSWILSYKTIELFLRRKDANREMVYRSSLDMPEKRALIQLIEWKELQLMEKPVFNNEGFLLDSNFHSLRGSLTDMNKVVADLTAKGYSVTVKPRLFLWRVKLNGDFTNTINTQYLSQAINVK